MTQEARVVASDQPQALVRILDRDGHPTNAVDAGAPITALVTAYPRTKGERLRAEFRVQHLESGTVVYRCHSQALGADSITIGPEEGIEIEWSMATNLGRGHYAIFCVFSPTTAAGSPYPHLSC
jgi:hypothetical protein